MYKLKKQILFLFVISYVINAMNSWVFKFIVPLVLYAETQSLQMMTTSYGLLFTPNIISPLLANIVEKGKGKKRSLLVLNTLGFLLCLSGFILFRNDFNNTIFLAFVFSLSCIMTLFQTIIHSIIKNVFHDNIAIEQTSQKIAFIDSLFPAIGPLIGALILNNSDYNYSFLIIGMTYPFSFTMIYLLRIEDQKTAIKEKFISKCAKGFKLIKNEPFISFLMSRFFLSNIALHGFQSVLTFYLIDKFHLTDIGLGFFFAVAAIGLTIGLKLGKYIYKNKTNKWYVISVSGIICSLCLIVMPLTDSIIVADLAWIVVMTLSSINLTVFYTERQTHFQQNDSTSVIAASYVIIYSAIPLGTFVSFIFSQHFNANETMLIFGAYLLFIGMYFLFLSISKNAKLNSTSNSPR